MSIFVDAEDKLQMVQTRSREASHKTVAGIHLRYYFFKIHRQMKRRDQTVYNYLHKNKQNVRMKKGVG